MAGVPATFESSTPAVASIRYGGKDGLWTVDEFEEAPVEALFDNPLHPYTRGLMRAIPRLDVEADAAGTRPRLQEIPGLVPILTRPIVGCAFAARCPPASSLRRRWGSS